MTNKTQEQGRESLEELAKQAIESPEEAKPLFKKISRYYVQKCATDETKEYWAQHPKHEYNSLKKRIQTLINFSGEPLGTPLYEDQLRLLLLALKNKKRTDFRDRDFFITEKLRYYEELEENCDLPNSGRQHFFFSYLKMISDPVECKKIVAKLRRGLQGWKLARQKDILNEIWRYQNEASIRTASRMLTEPEYILLDNLNKESKEGLFPKK